MNLLEYRFDRYTSTGNDGIIEKIFQILEIKNGTFVEFGAWDGIRGSNCRKLYEEGWGGVFIESDSAKYSSLLQNYTDDEQIVCINSRVGFESSEKFDYLVSEYVDNIDFCSIDIDGLDLEVFETFEKYLPTVVCIEGGQMLEPFYERIPTNQAKHNIQQSLSVMCSSFEQKGYKPLCSYQDTFFVKEQFFERFDVSKDIRKLYFDGLSSHHRRIPWIKMMVENVGLKNNIVNKVLSLSEYDKYGYNFRKLWAKEREALAKQSIDYVYKNMK